MGARSEALAKKFETKAQEATQVFESLSDADWKKVTDAEKWPVGVVAHHLAGSHAGIGGIVKLLADGKPGPNINMDVIHQGNAQHAKEFANCTQAETLALHKKNAADTAAMLRGLEDASLDHSSTVLAGAPAMSADQIAGGLLCSHIDDHLGSIKKTVGR